MSEDCDLIIVGGGPAGMSAALTAASEGLITKLLESSYGFGGQAGTSTLIENYAGFPHGITGRDLNSRMLQQARDFGVELVAPARVTESCSKPGRSVDLYDEDKRHYQTRCCLLACGVQYNQLRATNLAAFLGQGVNYGSPSLSTDMSDRTVYVIGGANSAGQAAIYLSKKPTCDVHLLVRAPRVETKMSTYLVDRIKTARNITVHTTSELVRVDGRKRMESITIKHDDGTVEKIPADHIYVLIGASPKLAWLDQDVARDDHGFVHSGSDMPSTARTAFEERCERVPFAHETSLPGIFIAGDVRSTAIRRVASAVGDGASAVSDIHQFLALENPCGSEA